MANDEYSSIGRRRIPPPERLANMPWETASRHLQRLWEKLAEGVPGKPAPHATTHLTSVGEYDGILSDTAASGLGNANAAGTVDEASRVDHIHKRTVRVAAGGTDVGTRNRLNFTTDFTVTDDSANDEVDIALAGSVTDESGYSLYLSLVM